MVEKVRGMNVRDGNPGGRGCRPFFNYFRHACDKIRFLFVIWMKPIKHKHEKEWDIW